MSAISPTESITGKLSAISTLSQSPERCLLLPTESVTGKLSISPLSQTPERCLLVPSREILFYFPTESIAGKVCLPCFPLSVLGNVLLPMSTVGRVCLFKVTLCQSSERSVFLTLPYVSRRKCLSCVSPVSVAGKVYLEFSLSVAGKVCVRKLSYVIYFPLCQSPERCEKSKLCNLFPLVSIAGKI